MPDCKHDVLRFDPSSHAQQAGYKSLSAKRLYQAAKETKKGDKKQKVDATAAAAAAKQKQHIDASTFPGPLVLPGDELAWDPDYEPQSLQEWIDEPQRNEIANDRRTVYVVPVPEVASSASYVQDWSTPIASATARQPSEQSGRAATKGADGAAASATEAAIPTPSTEAILSYLQAFYHNLPVKLLRKRDLEFIPWAATTKSGARSTRTPQVPSRIGLSLGSEAIGIRVRPSKDKLFAGQLNLNDLLDAAIALLPRDAYAVLMLVQHDLYEDDEDDFCCGRAYGGSRVAVVSMARYHPALDGVQEVERDHAWPASHCAAYLDKLVRESDGERSSKAKAKKASRTTTETSDLSSALGRAVQACNSLPHLPHTAEALSNLWLGRVCKTASHELGHCFGMDHCVYYACIMQGTAGLSEDARQPPYLCPVDLAKVLRATGADERERCGAMLEFCKRFKEDRMFSAFVEWLRVRLEELDK